MGEFEAELRRLQEELVQKRKAWEKIIPYSNFKKALWAALKSEGIVGSVEVEGEDGDRRLKVRSLPDAHPLRGYSDSAARQIVEICSLALTNGHLPSKDGLAAVRKAARSLSWNGYGEEARQIRGLLAYKPQERKDGLGFPPRQAVKGVMRAPVAQKL